MPTAADLEERAIWKFEQAGYGVTIYPDHGYIVTTPSRHAIATPASLNELRALADQFYELVWLGYRRVETA